MSSPCECRGWSCSSSRDFAVLYVTGHHPSCGRRPAKIPDDEEIIDWLLHRMHEQQRNIERLSARCNRMVKSAAIEDVTWRPQT